MKEVVRMNEHPLAENLAMQLRREILRGALPPGTSIKERDYATQKGVSRTPVREAIRILAKEGLLVLRHSRSPIVAQPGFKEIADAVEVLLNLEKFSIELACQNACDADMARITSIHQHIADNHNQLDVLELFEVDMSFHSAIVQASHNDALFATYRSYLERLWRVRFLSARQKRNRDNILDEHRRIVDALSRRDPVAATTAIFEHIGNLAENIRPVIEIEQIGSDYSD